MKQSEAAADTAMGLPMTEQKFQFDNLSKKHQDIHLILKDLLKVIKVVALYPEGNPLPESLKRTFAERLVHLAEKYGDLKFGIEKGGVSYEHAIVYADRSKEEALAALLFDPGITTLTFKSGLIEDEVYTFLRLLKDYQNSPGHQLDLVAALWEAGFRTIVYQTVEDIKLAAYEGDFKVQEVHFSERGERRKQRSPEEEHLYSALFRKSADDSGEIELEESNLSGDDEGFESNLIDDSASPPPSGVPMPPHMQGGDTRLPLSQARIKRDGRHLQVSTDLPGLEHAALFDIPGFGGEHLHAKAAAEAMGYDKLPSMPSPGGATSLILNDEHKLSQEEEERIRQLITTDAAFDLYESTLELCKEMLHQDGELTDFSETVTICEKIIEQFIAAGRLNDAIGLINYFDLLEGQVRSSRPTWAERLRAAKANASSREQMGRLSLSLNEYPDISGADLRRYLDLFGSAGMLGISELQGTIVHEQHRRVLSDYLVNHGRANVQTIAKGLFDKRVDVIRQTITILAEIGDVTSIGYLQRIVEHADRSVRFELVTSLQKIQDERCLELLKVLAYDADRIIGRTAIGMMVSRKGTNAYAAMMELLNDTRFNGLEREDQQAVLNAYSSLGGDSAIDYLLTLATRFNPLRDATVAFYRAAAFEALSHNRSERCERQLLKLAGSWRPDVKRQAHQALRVRREMIYGETT